MTTTPWSIEARELLALTGNGGQTFAQFVNALLRAEATAAGVQSDKIRTTTKVNVGDGGVDAEVTVPLGGPLGLTTATCWQFKATSAGALSASTFRTELGKPEATRLIQQGYAYVACVCDEVTSKRMNTLNAALTSAVIQLNPTAPAPRLLDAGQLAAWASRHPGVVTQFFRGHLGHALAYEAWLLNERSSLPVFVDLPARAEAANAIRAHVASANSPGPVLSVCGVTGAGVSRLVAETLSAVAPSVIYVPDATTAVRLATSIVNQPNAGGVFVVDRCNARTRAGLEDVVQAAGSRLRVIVIHDTTEEVSSATLRLAALEGEDVQKVIDANFGAIPPSHRRAFVHLADGVLKIAARLALSYVNDPTRFIQSEAAWADDELRRLVPDTRDRDALRALALFNRVGFSGDVSAQLVDACRIFRLEPKEVLRRARRLSQAPGVIASGQRYLAVRPRLFARPLFASAWREAVSESVSSFISSLSPALKRALLKQASVHAAENVREALADWMAPQAALLTAADLGSSDVLATLLPMVEVAPTRMGPVLADLVTAATDAEARAPGDRFDHWPARMSVVKALRELMERRDTYALAEAALFRLARVEVDVDGSVRESASASEKWTTWFRLFLSGTEVPLAERLAVLATRLDSDGPDAIPLIVAALGYTVSSHAWKTEGSPIVHGEIRRRDWQPSTYAEYFDGLDGAIALLGRCAADPRHGQRAVEALVRHGRGLLQSGRVKELRGVLDGLKLDELQRVAVRAFVGDFLAYDSKKEGDDVERRYPHDFIVPVHDWHAALSRSDLAGRVFDTLSRSNRRESDEQSWNDQLDALGAELSNSPDTLLSVMPSLLGAKSHAVELFALGQRIGRADTAGKLISILMAAARGVTNPLLHRGYVCGLAEQGSAHDAAMQAEVDGLEVTDPDLALDLSGMNSRVGSAARRAIRLVREGRLSAESLTRVSTIRFDGEILGDALNLVLDALVDRPEAASTTALGILTSLAWDEKAVLPDDSRTVEAIWRALAIARDGANGEAHTWGRLLRRLSDVDFERAAALACTVAVTGDFSMQDEAAGELSAYIGRAPDVVLSILGPMLLEPSSRWAFGGGRRGTVLLSFPVTTVIDWVAQNGLVAARFVANHLPSPHLDGEGKPVVPALTAFILEKFESDDGVFASFCSSRHTLQMYSGDIAGQHEGEAKLAEKFRGHKLRRVRQWAEQEVRWSRGDAKLWRERNEEDFDD